MADAGFFYGVGVGPGEPDLLTIRASQVIGRCDVVAYAAPYENAAAASGYAGATNNLSREQQLVEVDFGSGDLSSNEQKVDEAELLLRFHLREGRDVAFLCHGDPSQCIEFELLRARFDEDFTIKVVPGIPVCL